MKGPADSCRLIHEPSGRVIVGHLLTAFDSPSRRRGLLRRQHLDRDTALIIAPCNSIHTFFMQFSIDVAFMAKDGRILKIRRDVVPWRMAAAIRAHSVIEFAAGVLAERTLHVGDRLSVRRAE